MLKAGSGKFIAHPLKAGSSGGGLTPNVKLNFLSGILDQSITFTRSGNASYFNSSGVLTQAGTNIARFDYNPTTVALNGLLLEGAATNRIQYSNFPSGQIGVYWNVVNTTATANFAAAPDGTTTACKLPITNTGANERLATNVTVTVSSSTSYTLSGFFQASTAGDIGKRGTLYVYDTGTSSFKGAVTVTLAANWQRVSTTFTTGSSTTGVYCSIFGTETGTNDICTALIWGAQLEASNGLSIPTSYIPTTSGSATRNADSAVITSIPWFNAANGTLIVNAMLEGLNTTSAAYLAAFSDGTTSNSILSQVNTSAKPLGTITVSGSAKSSAGSLTSITANTVFKTGLAYASGANLFYTNGSADGAGTFGASTLPSGISQLNLGAREDGSDPLNGWLQSISYWNSALSSTQLQTATT